MGDMGEPDPCRACSQNLFSLPHFGSTPYYKEPHIQSCGHPRLCPHSCKLLPFGHPLGLEKPIHVEWSREERIRKEACQAPHGQGFKYIPGTPLINPAMQQILTEHLLNASTGLDARGTVVNKAKVLVLMDLKFQWEEMKIKYNTHVDGDKG